MANKKSPPPPLEPNEISSLFYEGFGITPVLFDNVINTINVKNGHEGALRNSVMIAKALSSLNPVKGDEETIKNIGRASLHILFEEAIRSANEQGLSGKKLGEANTIYGACNIVDTLIAGIIEKCKSPKEALEAIKELTNKVMAQSNPMLSSDMSNAMVMEQTSAALQKLGTSQSAR